MEKYWKVNISHSALQVLTYTNMHVQPDKLPNMEKGLGLQHTWRNSNFFDKYKVLPTYLYILANCLLLTEGFKCLGPNI